MKLGWARVVFFASAALLAIGAAQATPISFAQASVASIASNASFTTTFNASSGGSTLLQVDVGTVDEGFALAINGITIFDVPAFDNSDPGHPIGVSTGLLAPWVWDGQDARVRAVLTSTSLLLQGLIVATDASYTTLSLTGSYTLPNFVDGLNTLTITSRNQFGPGGMTNVSLSGTVPEPATLSLVGLVLVGLASVRLRQSRA